MDHRLILITLLVKVGAATAVATALVRSRDFKRQLFREDRTLAQKIYLTLFISFPIALGVVVRLAVKNFLAADFSFEGAIVMGVIGGRAVGAMGGALVSLPALFAGEYLALPVNVLAGLLAGVLRTMAVQKEEVWSFSPLIDLSIYRWIRKSLRRPGIYWWQPLFFVVIVMLEFFRIQLGRAAPGYLFYLYHPSAAVQFALYAGTLMTVATPLKIWNNARIEMKLEEQERLLWQARMEALQNQINPHFLFNTLNSVASLVRFDPDTAREVVVKLAAILRRLLRRHEVFSQLREELEFVDDYLDIEVVRFGRDKLVVRKELDPETLDLLVPSMLLQPLVENAIKHGLAPKVDGGSILLRSGLAEGQLLIEVADDGVGMQTAAQDGGTGIGMANIAERLKVLYGDSARMEVSSTEGKGTLIMLRLPILQADEVESGGGASAAYEARSSTQR